MLRFQVLSVDMAKYNEMYHVECASCMFRTDLAMKSPIQHGELYQEYHGFILPLNLVLVSGHSENLKCY